jgi:hypothetical protein
MVDEFPLCPAMPGQSGIAVWPNDARRVTRIEDRGIKVRFGPQYEVKPCPLPQLCFMAGADYVAGSAGPNLEELSLQVCCERKSAEIRAQVKRLLCGRYNDYRTRAVAGGDLRPTNMALGK